MVDKVCTEVLGEWVQEGFATSTINIMDNGILQWKALFFTGAGVWECLDPKRRLFRFKGGNYETISTLSEDSTCLTARDGWGNEFCYRRHGYISKEKESDVTSDSKRIFGQ